MIWSSYAILTASYLFLLVLFVPSAQAFHIFSMTNSFHWHNSVLTARLSPLALCKTGLFLLFTLKALLEQLIQSHSPVTLYHGTFFYFLVTLTVPCWLCPQQSSCFCMRLFRMTTALPFSTSDFSIHSRLPDAQIGRTWRNTGDRLSWVRPGSNAYRFFHSIGINKQTHM
jgi:hypothetical protein